MHSTTLPQFDKLVELHYPSLFHFAVRLCSSPERALRLTEGTFRQALDRSRELPIPSNVRSWLFTILFREFLERRARAPRGRASFTHLDTPALERLLEGDPQLN